jgi:decaprenyl-phosphate phosphoribosyltransferase
LFVITARPALVMTIPLVLYGLYRYWFIVESTDGGESPTDALLGDWQLLLTVAIWGVASAVSIWPGHSL